MVTFSLDKNGKVDKLQKYDLTDSNNKQLSATRGTFADKLVDSGVVVFVTDGSSYNAGKYTVSKIADLETKTDLKGSAYYARDGKVTVIIVTNKYTGADSVYAVINSINTAYNSSDEKVQYVTGFQGGKEMKVYTDNSNTLGTIDKTKPMVYELKMNSAGVIVNGSVSTGAAINPVEGYVFEKDGSYLIKVGSTTGTAQWCTLDKNVVVYEYSKTADDLYEVRSVSAVKPGNATAITGTAVTLYQMNKNSETYDVIIMK